MQTASITVEVIQLASSKPLPIKWYADPMGHGVCGHHPYHHLRTGVTIVVVRGPVRKACYTRKVVTKYVIERNGKCRPIKADYKWLDEKDDWPDPRPYWESAGLKGVDD